MKHATRMAMAWYEMRDFRQARCLQTPWVGFHRQPSTFMPGFRLFVGFCFDTLLFQNTDKNDMLLFWIVQVSWPFRILGPGGGSRAAALAEL